jgi:hypothetical protein
VGPSYPTTAKKEKKPSLVKSRKGKERKKKKKKKYQLLLNRLFFSFLPHPSNQQTNTHLKLHKFLSLTRHHTQRPKPSHIFTFPLCFSFNFLLESRNHGDSS